MFWKLKEAWNEPVEEARSNSQNQAEVQPTLRIKSRTNKQSPTHQGLYISMVLLEVNCLTHRTGTLTISCHTALHSVFQSFIANPLFLTVCSISYGPKEIIFVLNAVRKA